MKAIRTLLTSMLTVAALSGLAQATTYTVQVGDTLSSVAQRYGMQPQDLMKLNNMMSTTLNVGQKISTGSTATGNAASSQASAPARNSGNGYVRTAALRFLGIRYVHGGTGGWGMDCSGYTQAVFRSMGVSLPRTAAAQFRTGRSVGRSSLQAGDLMFFNTMGRGVSHVAIYLGGGQFANANSYFGRTMVDSLSNPYWSSRFIGARRVL